MSAGLLETLEELAVGAGALTLELFGTNIAVEIKPDESPVTIADRRAEEFLRREIERRFPDDLVVGEEFGESGSGRSGRRWILDPIDGTKSFVRGVPIYGVMIGVEQDGRVIGGAINLPALKELVVAEEGRGCWINGRRACVSDVADPSRGLLLTTDVGNIYKYGHGGAWERLCERMAFVRTWGDCYGYVLVATGRAEVMLDPVMAVWDAAPLPVILSEAGGRFTDLSGVTRIDGGNGLATNAALADAVREIVAG